MICCTAFMNNDNLLIATTGQISVPFHSRRTDKKSMADEAALALAAPDIAADWRADGTILLRSRLGLRSHPQRIGDVFTEAALRAPDVPFLAERRDSDWLRITYGTALEQARAIAQSLADRRFDQTTPVAILSDNSIRHALIALGALLVGVPIVPITPGILSRAEITAGCKPLSRRCSRRWCLPKTWRVLLELCNRSISKAESW
jgi:non-ribosomal peptide synthetase component F